MKPFDPSDPIHMAALALAKAERDATLAQRNPGASTATFGDHLAAKGRAREALLAALTESLQAAGAKGELRTLEIPT